MIIYKSSKAEFLAKVNTKIAIVFFILCIVAQLEFPYHIADYILLGFQQPGEIFL